MRSIHIVIALLAAALTVITPACAKNMTAPMALPEHAERDLKALVGQDHFAATPGTLYTGVRDPLVRASLNAQFDHALGSFLAAASRKASKSDYLQIIKAEIANFDRSKMDTEDAEQVGLNFEKAMGCLGIESSEGILNDWMYGFQP